jgi:hypothetical protein
VLIAKVPVDHQDVCDQTINKKERMRDIIIGAEEGSRWRQ